MDKDVVILFIGYSILLIISALILVVMPIIGLIICCCRCGGNCGGKVKEREGKYSSCCSSFCGFILFVLIGVMITMCIFMFVASFNFRNHTQQNNLIQSMESGLNDFNAYFENILDQIESFKSKLFSLVDDLPE